MNKQAVIENVIKTIKKLPKDKLNEVADFASFLLKKEESPNTKSLSEELSQLNKGQLNHLEEEFKDYKRLYPNE
ncbi:mRNA-degrading endonuclease RelE of RelBE toxin-antitoxin system [Catalinimonas alkaloidigena]|uniref:DUF2281 domain-containing protein n=1 Tax=Catalinimonas alkaloidigena TaxID=1075417 RepID=UPI002406AFE2|nr:DUF2281 domain-containing protein [Catalinimonas alkaloidigena]MDF9795025.1 mRNA-degrading endonuclease RelE of RelBE toxin-antitoxin system [Catalinimonas alkaloidigena]